MLKFLRYFLAGVTFFGGSLIILVACLFRPFNPRNALWWTGLVPPIAIKLMGLKVEVRNHERMKTFHPCVYIANHQHALDMFVCAGLQCVPMAAIGKKEIRRVPFFGWVFWLTGQVMIDRKHRSSALETMSYVAEQIKEKGISIWMFPEGTRNEGAEKMLPFKKGAFHLAVQAQIPLLPIAVSSYHKTIDLSRWNPGRVIVDVMEPISTIGKTTDDVESLLSLSRERMEKRIAELDKEILSSRTKS